MKPKKPKKLDFKRLPTGRIDHSGCGLSRYKCCVDCQRAFDNAVLLSGEQVRAVLGRIPRALTNMATDARGKRQFFLRSEVMQYV